MSHNLRVTTLRSFPIEPRSTRDLEIGDLVAVPVGVDRWGCLQVTDLVRTGTGSRTCLVVGVLDWRGDAPPEADSVVGSAVIEQGLTRIEIFTDGGLRVTGTCEVTPHDHKSNFRDTGIGTSHHVWGWQSAIRHAESVRG